MAYKNAPFDVVQILKHVLLWKSSLSFLAIWALQFESHMDYPLLLSSKFIALFKIWDITTT